MVQMQQTWLPALGATGWGHSHGYWWIILAIVVFALVAPLAYVLGHAGGGPDRRRPVHS